MRYIIKYILLSLVFTATASAQRLSRVVCDENCKTEQGVNVVKGDGFADRAFYKKDGLPLKRFDGAIVKEIGDGYITVCADRYIHAVTLEGDCIFDDNYFSLLPGEERTVKFDKGATIKATGYVLF